MPMARSIKNILLVFFLLQLSVACTKKSTTINQRSYRMGFMNSAPRPVFAVYLQSLNTWTTYADAAIVSTEVPWDSLLHGVTPQQYITNNIRGLVDYYRSKNLKLWVYIDPENGLDRSSDALPLKAVNKSIAQKDMQQVYNNFVIAMDTMLTPAHLGLALETNLIRGTAPDSIYQGVKNAANTAAIAVRYVDKKVAISVSVQVEYAWGRLGGNGTYKGIAQDYIDFPFIEELGLSSYPYFGYSDPADLPVDYYAKLVIGKGLPVFVSEGGWTSHDLSTTGATINSSLQKQQNYITRQNDLLENAHAIALFSLTFTDLDVAGFPPNTPASIQYFAYLGLVDTNLQPKPALQAWEALFKYVLKPGN